MKIIYLANVRLPTEKAHGYQIVRTAAAMVAAGAEVELVVPKRRNPKLGGEDVFAHYGVTQQFPIRWLPNLDLIRGKMNRFIGPLAFWVQTWTFARSVKKYLRTAQADWIYGRDELLLDQLQELPAGARLAVELHALPSGRYAKLLQRADRIIVITRAIKDGLVGQGITAAKIFVAADAVDLAAYAGLLDKNMARTQLGLSASEHRAVYTGHPYAWKGVYALAEASRYLTNGWRVQLVGGVAGDLTPLRRFVQAQRLDRVEILPHQSRPDLLQYVAAADVVVLPNSAKTEISRLYTSPLKLFEYLAAGRPIVASDLPSIREVVSEREVIFVKPDDPQDLARGIRQAVEQPQEDRVAAARALVKKYTWEVRARSILARLR